MLAILYSKAEKYVNSCSVSDIPAAREVFLLGVFAWVFLRISLLTSSTVYVQVIMGFTISPECLTAAAIITVLSSSHYTISKSLYRISCILHPNSVGAVSQPH